MRGGSLDYPYARMHGACEHPRSNEVRAHGAELVRDSMKSKSDLSPGFTGTVLPGIKALVVVLAALAIWIIMVTVSVRGGHRCAKRMPA
jgi:hypothetical protein